jgi:hypothetical protein
MADPFDTIPQLQYDIRAAQKAGLTEADIAQYASKRRNYDYQSARKAGLTDADLIRHNIANVSESGAGGAFVEEALTAVPVSIAMGAGTAAGYGAGLAGAAALGLTGPVGLGVAVLSGLTGLIASGGLATAAIDKVKDVTGLGGEQYVPSAQVGAIAGETVGFVTGMGLPTLARGVAAKLGGTSVGKAFGFKELGAEVAKAGDDVFMAAGVKPVDLGSSVLFANAASSPRLASAVKNLEVKLSQSRASRMTSPGAALVKDTAIAGYMGAYGAGAEAIDPGNVPLRVAAEVVGGIFNPASLFNAFGSKVANASKNAFNKVTPGSTAEEGRIVGALQKMVDDIARQDGNINLEKSIKELEDALPDVLTGADRGSKVRRGRGKFKFEGPTQERADKIPKLNITEKTNDQLIQIIGGAIRGMKGGEASQLTLRSLAQSKKSAKDIGYILDELSLIESPALMSEIANLKETVYAGGMQAVLDTAVLKATDYANLLANRAGGSRRAIEGTQDGKTVFTPGGEFIGDKTNAGQVMLDTLFAAAEASRKIEKSKWEAIDKTIEVNLSEILNFYDRKVLPSADGSGGSVAEEATLVKYLPIWVKEQREISMAVLNEKRAVQRAPFEEQLAKLKVQQETAVKEVPKTRNEYDPTFLGRQDAALRKVKSLGDGIDSAKREIEALKPYTLATLPNNLVKSTVGRVQQFRSTNLGNSRVTIATELGAPQSGFYGKMAEKALDDLSAAGTGLSKKEQILYDDARAFSKAFNDVFSRGFGGDLIKKSPDGSDRMTPESLANTLINTAGNLTAARLGELESALDFIIKRTPDPVEQQRFKALKKYDYRGATEIILRDLLSKNVIDNLTGEIKPRLLARELTRYKDVFALPGMKVVEQDLKNAQTAQKTLLKMREDIKKTGYTPSSDGTLSSPRDVPSRGRMTEEVLGKSAEDIDAMRVFLTNSENPTAEIITIRGSNNPAKSIEGLAGLVKRPFQKGEGSKRALSGDPVKGLQQVVVDAAVESSRKADGTIDFAKFREFLLEPMTGRASTSMGEVLKRNEIISTKELEDLRQLAIFGERTQKILDNADNPEAIMAELEMSGSLLAQAAGRAAGAGAFTTLMRNVYRFIPFINRPQGIVEAGIGANLAGKYFSVLPYAAQQRLFFDAYNDRQLMADMMKKIKQPSDIIKFHKQNRPILESLLGLETYREISEEIKRDDFFEEEVTEEVIEEPVPMAMAPAPQRSEPLVDTNVREMAMAPTPPPPAQRQQARPASAPTNRSQYAAMFPYDTASEVIRSQEGIASLMT